MTPKRAQLGADTVDIANGYTRTDDPTDLYVTSPRSHYAKTDYMYVNKVDQLDAYEEKIRRFYRGNLETIQRIAYAYQFQAVVVLQPNGMILDTNPFIKDIDDYRQQEIYRLLSGMYASVRTAIRRREIPPMIDLSDLHDGCTDCYVDLAHYHPSFNRRLASAILDRTQPKPLDLVVPNP